MDRNMSKHTKWTYGSFLAFSLQVLALITTSQSH